MDPRSADLPIAAILPELRAALAARTAALLVAPPGAGKTTLVPLSLLDAPWLAGAGVLVLEPRRLAARAAARRMAQILGQEVGHTVGFATRFERRVGPATRITVVTEGLFTRRIQRDPGLEGVGLVIFDEAHERSLDTDLGLVLALDAQAGLQPELRLLLMSATLDVEIMAGALEGAEVVRSAGRMFDVETRFSPPRADLPIETAVADAVLGALAAASGDVLAFLPGAREIRRAQALIQAGVDARTVQVLPLMGEIGAAEQDRALRPDPAGARKVVLATDIAETSLTVEGVRIVVDSGLARRPVLSPRTGMSRLATVRIARSAADQRRGRAGREAPGLCIRLWSPAEDRRLAAMSPPEIATADLAPLALDLAAWGAEPAALRWPTPPPAPALARARALLTELGAVDPDGRVTTHGRAMAELPLHPRLAHMLLRGAELGHGPTAVTLAALLSGRDPWRTLREPDLAAKLRLRAAPDHGANRAALAELVRIEGQLRRLVRVPPGPLEPAATGLLIALAWPERIAQRRGSPGTLRTAQGRGAGLDPLDPLARSAWLAIAELDDTGPNARILSAAALDPAALPLVAGDRIQLVHEVAFDAASQAVVAREVRQLGALVLAERLDPAPDPAAVATALLDEIRRRGVAALPWDGPAAALRARAAFLARHAAWPGPDWSDAGLEAGLDIWLGPWVPGLPRWSEIEALDLARVLQATLDTDARGALARRAPTDLALPADRSARIDYASDPPQLAARAQALFGLDRHPTVLDGRVALAVILLSPAGRPIQTTRDLPGFWRGSWSEVRKQMRGRYPRHAWPEEPWRGAG